MFGIAKKILHGIKFALNANNRYLQQKSQLDEIEQSIENLNKKMAAIAAIEKRISAFDNYNATIDRLHNEILYLNKLLNGRFEKETQIITEIDNRIEHNKELLNKNFALLVDDNNKGDFRYNDLVNRLNDTQRELLFFRSLWQTDVISQHNDMNYSEIYQHIKSIRGCLLIQIPDNSNKFSWIRVGRNHDGGYVMFNDFSRTRIAYSLGIADDISWDKDLLVKVGGQMDIYQYDHTIDDIPESNPHFHWEKIGICGIKSAEKPILMTLSELIEKNNHINERNMILKMDIEGTEYDVLNNINPVVLKQFSQILIEFHDLANLESTDNIVNALKKLNETHQLVHVHGNNNRPFLMQNGLVLPDALECTYLNRDTYQFEHKSKYYPTQLDQANNTQFPDIELGCWG